ncbi:MAG: hypothetical protein K0S65_1823 [Labilithrix sp.]|nr:hypothetical protein [Labilithrix sp.]
MRAAAGMRGLMNDRLERAMRGLATRSVVLATALGLTLVAFACASNNEAGPTDSGERDGGSLVIGPTDAGGTDGDAGPSLDPMRKLCIATECPAPFATCPVNGVLPEFRCGTDLSTSLLHCGACGNSCGTLPDELHMVMSCVHGECEALCAGQFLNCNGIIEDGCEANTLSDPNNCGGCGKQCAPDVQCRNGICGCPPGQEECDGSCKNINADDYNCGGCGVVCSQAVDAGAVPPHMYRGCVNGTCGELKCDVRESEWTDCNGTLSDGCEINLFAVDEQGRLDPNNCGTCGNKCSPGTQCLALETIDCWCKTGQTLCDMMAGCKDLENDPTNCGSCGFGCGDPVQVPENVLKGDTTCRRGHCGYACRPGFADCNDRLDDGCETDLSSDPRSCGVCGKSCATNQPCVNGACVVRECAPGDPQ